MQLLWLVALGGALGSVVRYILGQLFLTNGLILVNILGSFLLGCLVFILGSKSAKIEAFLIYGFCGGFTTFASFALLNFKFIQLGQIYVAIENIIFSVGLSILGIAICYLISSYWIKF